MRQRCAGVERHRRQPVLDGGELFEDRPVEIAAEIRNGSRDARPDRRLRIIDEFLSLVGQRHQSAALIVRCRLHIDEAEFKKLADRPRRAGLGDAHRLGELADGQRPGPVDRRQERILTGLNAEFGLVDDLLCISLQSFPDAPQAASQTQKAERSDHIFDHADLAISIKCYITRYILRDTPVQGQGSTESNSGNIMHI